MSTRWSEVDALCLAAIERPEAEREQFLVEACGGRRDLLEEVRAMLRYEARSGHFLEGAALVDEAKAMVEESPPSLVGQQIGGYQIEALVAAGGMGEVYRGRDVKLERDAAIKVLGRFVAGDTSTLRRFEEEARLASGLNHPNIVTIYGIGEHAGITFLAMELVEGQTLRDVCRGRPLAIKQALELALQLADALAAAHAIGIVHGDLKPENVMVTGNQVLKVLDFGLARRVLPAGTDTDQAGPVIGSVGYIAPEVMSGRPATPSADQFSFGAILYEMLSGRRAFPIVSAAGRANLLSPPALIRDVNADVPARLAEVVTRCLAEKASERYPDTRTLAAEIRGVLDDSGGHRLTRRRALLIGSAVATLAAAAIWQTPFGSSGTGSIAILPFVDASFDGSGEHLSNGLTDSLIRRVSQLPSLHVAPRTAVSHFKGGGTGARAAGQRLGVDAVLQGSVARRGARLIISAELFDVRTGSRLWSQQFERPAAEMVLVQDAIVDAVVALVRQPVSEAERRQLRRHPTDDPDAFEMYLKAMHHIGRETENDYLRARALLQQAIDRDDTFAFAHRALASTYSVMAIDGFERPSEAWPQSSRHVQRALELDPELADAHAEAAMHAFFFKWDWVGAERQWQAATRSRASYVEPDLLMVYALQCFALGRVQEALRLAREARRLDPISVSYKVREADYLFHAGRADEAIELYERATAEDPDDSRGHFGLAEARRSEGRYAEALQARHRAHRAAGDTSLDEIFSSARGEEGYRRIEEASARLHMEDLAVRATHRYACPLDIARFNSVLHRTDEAFRWLERAFQDRSSGLVFLNVDRAWDSLRADARFTESVRRVGLVVV